MVVCQYGNIYKVVNVWILSKTDALLWPSVLSSLLRSLSGTQDF